MENVIRPIHFDDVEGIFDIFDNMTDLAEKRDQKLCQPFARWVNVERKLPDARRKRVASIQFPLGPEQAQFKPPLQSLGQMISRRDRFETEFGQVVADCLGGLIVQEAAPDIRSDLIKLVDFLSSFAEQDRPVVKEGK